MLLLLCKVKNTPLNLGEPVELLPEFPEFLDLVLIDQVKPLSVTNVEKVECLLP